MTVGNGGTRVLSAAGMNRLTRRRAAPGTPGGHRGATRGAWGVPASLGALWLAACTPGDNATPAVPPALAITSPDCSAGALKPTAYNLEGTVDGDVQRVWFEVTTVSGSVAEVEAVVGEDGVARGTYTFADQGSYTIGMAADTGLSVYYADGELSCAVVNASPTVTILSPQASETFDEEATVTLLAQVADDDDEVGTLTVTWSSARDGELGTATPGADGKATLEVTGLTAFNHILTARVADPWDAAAEDTVTVTVEECEDKDGDGASECSDCDDRDAAVNPAAAEVCDGKDNDCNGEIDELGDADGDGQPQCVPSCTAGTDCVLDCDDTDAAVAPGKTEVCDTIDNNCDGQTDEGFDLDQDGYSNCTVEVDCNDQNPNAHPGLTETCDAVDQDCDGAIDEGLNTTYYRDSDRDGYGDPANSLAVCTPGVPPGFSTNADDCDDTQATVFPGGTETCDGLDNNCDGTIDEGQPQNTFYADLDGDDHGDLNQPVTACVQPETAAASSDDCDDTDPAIYPGAVELCDTLDGDCDLRVDEGVQTTFYADPDGDGYGAADATQDACTQPPGFVTQAGDCGPADDTTFPGATELCDTVDNDCDSTTDEGAAETFYYDGDGDTYGSNTNTQITCSPSAGYIARGGDCNDSAVGINPGATETCDGRDQDCDSTTDEGVQSTYYQDADGDGYGTSTQTAKACSVPDGYSAAQGDCDDAHADSHPGATELCDGRDNDCNGELDNGLVLITWYTDGDGDGWGDSASTVEACAGPTGTVNKGGDCKDANAAIYPGATESCNARDDDCDSLTDEGVKTTFYKDVDRDTFGSTETRLACTLCDGCSTNDDDCDDDDALTYPGAPERFDGEDNDCNGAAEREMGVGAANVVVGGVEAGSYTGAAVGQIGDIDGDGLDDLAFSAPRYSGRRGIVYVIYGKTSGWGSLAASAADVSLTMGVSDVEAGTSISGGDINNDGVSDLFIGIPKYDSVNGAWPDGGHVSFFYGGGRLPAGDMVENESNHVEGYFPQVNMGFDLDARGDVTCDGIPDALIAAPWTWTAQLPNPSGGAVFILPGKNSDYTGVGGVGGSELIQIYGASNDMLGQSVSYVGNASGSSCGDFLATADGKTGMGPQAKADIGRTYLIGGGDSTTLPLSQLLEAPNLDLRTWDGSDATDRTGRYSDGVGDVDGDGAPDMIIGREKSTTGEPLAMMFLGGSTLPASGAAESQADVAVTSNAGLKCPCLVGGLGDINSDGLDDWSVTVPGAASGGTIFVFFGDEAGWPRTMAAEVYADLIITAEQAGDEAGIAITGVGDLNGDGAGDFAIGARSADGQVDGSGEIYVFFGY